MGELFYEQVLPSQMTGQKKHTFTKQYIYMLSHIKIGEPLSLYLGAIPYMKDDPAFRSSYEEIAGYFEQEEDTKITREEIKKQQEEAVKEEKVTRVVDLKDPKEIFNNYMFASAQMEFAPDMIEEWNFEQLLNQPIRLDETKEGPQILIFHTHSREEYKGGLTVVDVADALKQELETNYGIPVLHIKDEFYEESNKGNRPTGGEYERMEPVIREVLKKYPSISVVIDMHRDGVDEKAHLVTQIDGKETARIMFVNGLCRNRNVKGEVVPKIDLPNPYIGDNLAFSLQMLLAANEMYPGFARKIYCTEWRFSTHMVPQSLLMEWGAQTNTGEEALNAVKPTAQILAKVLQKD